MITNTFFVILLVGTALAVPVPQEELDVRSRLPANSHPSFKKGLDISELRREVPEDFFNKLHDAEEQQKLENIIEFLKNNRDLMKFADKEEVEGIFQGIDNVMRKVMDAAKETISDENKSIHNSALSLKDAGKQILETGTQLGKTGLDLTLMLPKFGFNILRQSKK